jgi:hypothetical protein
LPSAPGSVVPRIVTFECRDFSYLEFEMVFRVLNSLYIRPCDMVRHSRVLDYFGVSLDGVLVSVANAGNAGQGEGELTGFEDVIRGADDDDDADDGADSEASGDAEASGEDEQRQEEEEEAAMFDALPLPAMAIGLDGKVGPPRGNRSRRRGKTPKPPLADEAIIVCTTEERARVVAEAAKRLELPYVRFHCLFAEGRIAHDDPDGGVSDQKGYLPMQPVWVTLGDYDSILAMRKILPNGAEGLTVLHEHPLKLGEYVSRDERALKPEHEAALKTPGTLIRLYNENLDVEEWPGAVSIPGDPGKGGAAWFGLVGGAVTFKCYVSDSDEGPTEERDEEPVWDVPLDKKHLYDFLMPPGADASYYSDFPELVALPGGGDMAVKIPQSFFHCDSRGAACFTAEEAAAASAHLIAMEFLTRVQSRISTTAFLLPQESKEQATHFCNSSVYGKMNFLEVSGVVRLAPLTKPLPTPAPIVRPPPPTDAEWTPNWGAF